MFINAVIALVVEVVATKELVVVAVVFVLVVAVVVVVGCIGLVASLVDPVFVVADNILDEREAVVAFVELEE
jgi:hypothetical protein